MQVPLELSFRNVRKTPDVEELIERKVKKLEEFCDYISSCRVAVERPHQHEESGNPYRVRLDLRVPPGHEIIVDEDPMKHQLNEELRTVINSAFEAAERQLKEVVERQRGEVKRHQEPIAFVVRMFDDYGFLKTPQAREVYFHRNSVIGQDWERLDVGTQVRFEESMGEDGPQATTVQIIDKPGARHHTDDAEPAEPPAAREE